MDISPFIQLGEAVLPNVFPKLIQLHQQIRFTAQPKPKLQQPQPQSCQTHPLSSSTFNKQYSVCTTKRVARAVNKTPLALLTVRLTQKIMQISFTLLTTYFIIVGILNLIYPFTHLR
jgi:hypothetical protein